MQKRWLFLLLLLFTLTGCQSEQSGTPAPTASATAPLAISRVAQPIAIGALALAPEAYVNQMLQITGQFQPQPRLVCAADPKPSPASWGLMADGYLAYVQGMPQVNEVAAKGLAMTVEGRWRHWEGEVGCGKEVYPQEVWYLELTRVLSPSPISRVTLTPPGGVGQLLAGLEETAVPNPIATPILTGTVPLAPTEAPTLPSTTSVPTIPNLATATPTLAIPGGTSSPTATPAEKETAESTTTPTAEGTAGQSTATSTGTPQNPNRTATPSATPGSGGSTSTATPTPGGATLATSTPIPTLVGMGEIETHFLAVETINSGEFHSWDVDIMDTTVFTAYVATVAEDVALTLISPDGDIVKETNDTPGSGVEVLTYEVDTGGIFGLQIRSVNGAATDYVMMLDDSNVYPFVLRGILNYGSSQTVFLPQEQDHFWHFQGSAGDEISITVVPDGEGDPFIKFYDTEAIDVSGFVDDTGPGEGEVYSITLPETGIYSIRVGEFDFLEMDYTILVTKGN